MDSQQDQVGSERAGFNDVLDSVGADGEVSDLLNRAVFSGQEPKNTSSKNLGKGAKLAIILVFCAVLAGGAVGIYFLTRPQGGGISDVANKKDATEKKDERRSDQTQGEDGQTDKEEEPSETDKGEEEKKEPEESEGSSGQSVPTPTPVPVPTPTPVPTETIDVELIGWYNQSINFYAGDSEFPKYLYSERSATSDEDALGIVRGIGDYEDVRMSGKADDIYTVTRAYYNGARNYVYEGYMIYRSDRFDVVTETFNPNESYFWGNANNRLKNFFDAYVQIRNLDKRMLSGKLTEDSSNYYYAYSMLGGEYDGTGTLVRVKMYEGTITANKQTRKCVRSGLTVTRETTTS